MRRILIPVAAVSLLGTVVICGSWMIRGPGKERRLPPSTGAPAANLRASHTGRHRPRDLEPGRDPAAAADLPRSLGEATAAAWEDPAQLARHLKSLTRWAAVNPAACRDWLRTQPAALQGKLIPEIAGSLMAESPLEAFLFLNEQPSAQPFDEMLRQAAMEIATRDPAAALDWAAQQTDDGPRELLLAAIFLVQAQTAPETAAKAALEQIHDPTRRGRVVVEIAQRWVQRDPAAVAAFVGALEGPTSPAAAHVVASQWVLTDAAACGTWILTLPPLAAHAAFRPFLDHQLLHDRDGLTRLAPALQDPELREMLAQTLEAPL